MRLLNSTTGITKALLERIGHLCDYVELEDGSPEWLEYRKASLGSSDIGAAMGIEGAFKSAVQLWAEKSGLQPEAPIDARTEERFYWGHASEDIVTARFLRDFPEWEAENTGTYTNKERTFQRINPDRLLRNKQDRRFALLEIKTSEQGAGWGEGRVPQYYVAQVRYQLSGMGLTEGYVAVKIGNSEFRVYRIMLDASAPITNMHDGSMYHELEISERNILACADGFLRCVASGYAPQIDGSVSAWNTVRKLDLRRIENSELVITKEEALALNRARQEAEYSEGQLRRMKANLVHRMASAHRVVFMDGDKKRQIARRDKASRGDGFTFKLLKL